MTAIPIADTAETIPQPCPAYFKISRRVDEDNQDDEFESEVCFQLDQERRPIKLGDGSYGSVYLGRTRGGEPVAIKLLYNNSDIQPRQLKELTNGELEQLLTPLVNKYHLYANGETAEIVAQNKGRVIALLKETIAEHKDTVITLAAELKKIYTSHGQTAFERPAFQQFWDDLSKLAGSSAISRFERERNITAILRRSIQQADKDNVWESWEVDNIVQVQGGCNNFLSVLEEKEFIEIKQYFKDTINVSNYVLVSKRYNYSLKDLLERPYNGRGKNGYAVPKELSHELRVCEALLIITQAVFGLKTLHNAVNSKGEVVSLFHRDIKPGNIFVLVKADGSIEVALGDLGNLPSEMATKAGPGYDRDYAPGTRHYRSPEQQHNRDIADVYVKHIRLSGHNLAAEIWGLSEHKQEDDDVPADLSNNADMTTALIIRDPKFQNTFIEKGDIVIFSKDDRRSQYTIIEIILPEGEENQQNTSGHIAFILDKRTKAEDDKTQVEFYKSQRHRTDLFGIGAVLYDMMTVGRSPEQFYESIRKYEGQPVSNIVEKYEALRGGLLEGENPDFAEIFRPFRNENDPINPYPESDIIGLILKCLLYQSPGTFYNDAIEETDEPHNASAMLSAEVAKLRNKTIGKRTIDYPIIPPDKSILIHDFDVRIPPEEQGLSQPFHQRIDELQGLTNGSDDEQTDLAIKVANRLMYGAYYFWQMTEFVRETILMDNQSSQTPSVKSALVLRQILPTFISLQWADSGRKSQPRLKAMPLAIDPLNDLINNRLELLISSPANPFVPNEIASMRRDIRLLPQGAGTNGDNTRNVRYHFRDASIISRTVAKGDWIAIEKYLGKIVDIPDKNANELEIELENLADEEALFETLFRDNGYIDATYFALIDPLKYYFEMLALYLQHLIFTYSPITKTTRNRVDIYALLRIFEIGPDYSINEPLPQTANKLRTIHEQFVHMFVKLTLHETKGSYYHDVISETGFTDARQLAPGMFNKVHNKALELYGDIMTMLKSESAVITEHPEPVRASESLSRGFKELVDELTVDHAMGDRRIAIEEIIKRSGQIEGEDVSVG